MRWREDYFPFTEPSFELDIFFNGDWMEVLGCGVIHDEVMANAGECYKLYIVLYSVEIVYIVFNCATCCVHIVIVSCV
jgi:tRNA synthetases class II core domain (F)